MSHTRDYVLMTSPRGWRKAQLGYCLMMAAVVGAADGGPFSGFVTTTEVIRHIEKLLRPHPTDADQ